MIFPVLIDNCAVLFVKLHNVLFVLNGELILITLNKETLPLWISEENLSLFCATPFFAQKSVLIEWHWDCYHLEGLICSFFRSLLKIRWSLSHVGIFIANKKEGISQLSLRILPKKKVEQSNTQMWHTKHYYVFLKSCLES